MVQLGSQQMQRVLEALEQYGKPVRCTELNDIMFKSRNYRDPTFSTKQSTMPAVMRILNKLAQQGFCQRMGYGVYAPNNKISQFGGTITLCLRLPSLHAIAAKIEEEMKARHPGEKLEIVKLEVQSGLPQRHYGQTVRVEYRQRDLLVRNPEAPDVTMGWVATTTENANEA